MEHPNEEQCKQCGNNFVKGTNGRNGLCDSCIEEKVQIILKGLAQIAERPKDNKGDLNIEAFNNLPEVEQTVKRLKELGVTEEWLRKKGFMIARMLLKI